MSKKYTFQMSLLTGLLAGVSAFAFAQNPKGTEDYFNPNFVRFENHIYKPNIKSVVLTTAAEELTTPIIELNAGTQFLLGFDDLEGGTKDYHYTLVHCDAAWQPSELIQSQYLNGFVDDRIIKYEYSFNTTQRYIHYSLTFPTVDLQPTISGNYILKVYIGTNVDDLVLTRRFMIVEPHVSISANIHRATIVDDRDTRQEVDFNINHTGYAIDDPYSALHIVITQNDRFDNAVTGLKPMFVKEGALEYNYDQGNTFNGGNEFRTFDTRSLRYHALNIADITFDSAMYHVGLLPDPARGEGRYSIIPDINGKFKIHIQERDNVNTDADYTLVHFTFPYPNSIPGGNLYIYGQLSDWEPNRDYMMHYNYTSHAYEGAVYLKQGYYNYEYVFLKDGKAAADETLVEGNHFETENDYTIYVYHRPVGSRYDKLIGVQKFNSKSYY
jgi:hypothetical protein